jgi:hypothetical protein
MIYHPQQSLRLLGVPLARVERGGKVISRLHIRPEYVSMDICKEKGATPYEK